MRTLSRREALIAAGSAALALAGCSGGGGSTTGSSFSGQRVGAMKGYGLGSQFRATQPLSFTYLYDNNPAYPYQSGWLFWSELQRRTNVTLEPTIVELSDYEAKRSLLIGAGQAPQIIPKTYPGSEARFVGSGAILPVSDYVDLLPSFRDKVSRWNLKGDIDTLRQADGRYYLLPGLHEAVWQDYSLAMRFDVLAKLDLPSSWPQIYGQRVPRTWNDVYDVLKAMKQAYPSSYPLSDRWAIPTPGGNLLNLLALAYGTSGGWGMVNGGPATWDYGRKQYAFAGTMAQYKSMLQYVHRLVAEKLLDPESFTQSDDQAKEKLGAGRSFAISSSAQTLVIDCRPALQSIPGATIHKIPVPIGPMGPVNFGIRLENGVMLSSKVRSSPDFVALMQLIDWLWYSDAGQLFAKWGVQGTTYTGSVDAGTFKLQPDVDWGGLHPGAPKSLQKTYGFFNGIFAYGGSTKFLDTQFPAEELEFQKVMAARGTLPVPPPYPLTTAERQQASLWQTPLLDYVQEMTLQFILGNRPFSQWNDYVNELKGKSMEQYMNLVQTAHQRYQKKFGG